MCNILKQLNKKFGEAEKNKENAFFDKHLSDDLLFRRASGKIVSKEEFLADLQNQSLNYHHIKTDVKEISISKDESKAVVKAIVFVKMENEGYFTNLRFFQKQNDTWMLTAWYNEMSDKNNRHHQRRYQKN